MSMPPSLADRIDDIVSMLKVGATQKEIAQEMGVSQPTMSRAVAMIRASAKSGAVGTDPVMPGFEISSVTTEVDMQGGKKREFIRQRPSRDDTFEAPAGHEVKGISALVDSHGKVIQQWVKTRQGELAVEDVIERCKAALEGYEPARVEPQSPLLHTVGTLTLLPVNDWHVGMYAWSKEAAESWDLSIAERRLKETTHRVIGMSPPSEVCVILVGGDLLHADNLENKTAKSGNPLDVDGRYAKVLEVAARLLVDAVETALQRHHRVIVRVLRGNHDEHSAMAVAMFMRAWFRVDARVEVDTDPGLFWWYRHGKVMLGSTHGHTVKPEQMAAIMAARRPEDWGATRHRYVHTFHLHHKRLYGSEEGGVTTEVHQAPIPQDAWHYGAGFLSGRSMQAITYHAERGEISRVRVAMDATSGSREP